MPDPAARLGTATCTVPASPMSEQSQQSEPQLYLQRDQPPGVPPLALTGERTLPDVPEENYWYQRHLVVYEWIRDQVAGLRVIDMACGEGYGTAVLAGEAGAAVGVDANPEAHEHARLRYTGANLRFARDLVETFAEPADAVVFLQTIEHVQNPDEVLERFKALVADSRSPVVFVSTPNVLTLAPDGAEKSGNPWHVKEYRPEEFRRLCAAHFSSVEMHGLFHARKLAVHELAIKKARWDDVHAKLGITKRFYDWFTPAISVSDFALTADRPLERALDFVAVCRP
jgi:2-polyprenyl-3-methyl-5-hydroxy-6-metoxy-1,4-benzoquinol methylase